MVQEELINSQAKGPLTDPAYIEALATCRRLARAEGLDPLLARHRLDAIVAPTSAPAHVTDLVLGDHGLGDSTTPAAVRLSEHHRAGGNGSWTAGRDIIFCGCLE